MTSQTNDYIVQVLACIREYKNVVESQLMSGWKSQQTVELEQEWLEAVGQPAVPTASGPVTTALNVIGKTAIMGARLNTKEKSEGLRYIFNRIIFSEVYFTVIAIHQDMCEQEKQKVIKLEQSIIEAQIRIQDLTLIWEKGREVLGLAQPITFIVHTLRRMPSANRRTFLNIGVGMHQAGELIKTLRAPVSRPPSNCPNFSPTCLNRSRNLRLSWNHTIKRR
jgi:hypothetical protein